MQSVITPSSWSMRTAVRCESRATTATASTIFAADPASTCLPSGSGRPCRPAALTRPAPHRAALTQHHPAGLTTLDPHQPARLTMPVPRRRPRLPPDRHRLLPAKKGPLFACRPNLLLVISIILLRRILREEAGVTPVARPRMARRHAGVAPGRPGCRRRAGRSRPSSTRS